MSPEQGGTVLEAKLAASIAALKQPKEIHPPAAIVNGNGNGQAERCSLDQAMKAAIDVCVRGEKYAAAKGLAIGFLAGDVRAICIALVNGQQKGDR